MQIKRRNFIKSSSLLAGSVLLAGKELSWAKSLAAPALRVRKNVANLSPTNSDLSLYSKAVQVMKQRPASDPTSWHYQASIHYNFCPHGNWFFLPWHRAYLLKFEEICRAACGNPAFNLPYWDWTTHPTIPASFWGNGNVLFDNTRQAGPTTPMPAEFVGPPVIATILNLDSYEDFGSYKAVSQRPPSGGGTGQLEGRPHNNVHGRIGGNMGNYWSPLDPIFWLHHANIDRLWATWNDRGHQNSTDVPYNNYVFKQNFHNINGAPVDIVVKSMMNERNLGYMYDTQHNILNIPRLASTFNIISNDELVSTASATATKQAPAVFSLAGAQRFSNLMGHKINKGNAVTFDQISTGKKEIKIILSDIVPPGKEDFFVRVFVDAPDLTVNTPITDPHYVGSISFFGSNHVMKMDNNMEPMPPHRLKFVLDATRNLSSHFSVSTNKVSDEVKVQLIAVPMNENSEAKLTTGKVEIVIAEKAG
ncbi:MAG: hypothetical protein JWQ84_1328 [Mucilaginibacter sp.]|nr:hypothetical protein [Mucilaginibacter sp.]